MVVLLVYIAMHAEAMHRAIWKVYWAVLPQTNPDVTDCSADRGEMQSVSGILFNLPRDYFFNPEEREQESG